MKVFDLSVVTLLQIVWDLYLDVLELRFHFSFPDSRPLYLIETVSLTLHIVTLIYLLFLFFWFSFTMVPMHSQYPSLSCLTR